MLAATWGFCPELLHEFDSTLRGWLLEIPILHVCLGFDGVTGVHFQKIIDAFAVWYQFPFLTAQLELGRQVRALRAAPLGLS